MKNIKTLIALAATQCVYVLFSPLWLYFAMISVFMFDSPEAANQVWPYILFWLIWLYPLGLIAGAIGSWVCYWREKRAAAWWWNAIPLFWVLPIGSFTVFAFVI